MNDHSCYELTYIDVAGRQRKEEVLATFDRSMAIAEFASVVSPHVVELWQGSKLIASRRPSQNPVISTDWSVGMGKLHQQVVRQPAKLLKRFFPLLPSRKIKAAA